MEQSQILICNRERKCDEFQMNFSWEAVTIGAHYFGIWRLELPCPLDCRTIGVKVVPQKRTVIVITVLFWGNTLNPWGGNPKFDIDYALE